MKKIIFKFFIYSVLFSLFIILGINSLKKMKEKIIAEGTIQIFNKFCALSIGNNHEFCTDSLPVQPIFLLFMHPECDFCNEEINQIKKYQNVFDNVSILLISTAQKNQAVDFYSKHKLSQFNNIRFLIDEDFRISNFYNVKVIPTVFIYGNNKKLIFTNKGEIKIETIIYYLSKE